MKGCLQEPCRKIVSGIAFLLLHIMCIQSLADRTAVRNGSSISSALSLAQAVDQTQPSASLFFHL